MKNVFAVSFIHNGLLGGVIYLDDNGATYQTSKISVAPEYRNLKMPYSDIAEVECGRALIFPTVTIKLKNNQAHKFMIFNKKGFINRLKDYRGECRNG